MSVGCKPLYALGTLGYSREFAIQSEIVHITLGTVGAVAFA